MYLDHEGNRKGDICQSELRSTKHESPHRMRAHFCPLSCVYINLAKSCKTNSGHFTTSENKWNRRNTTKLVFPSLCPLKSKGEDFKNGFQIFEFSWIWLYQNILLKHFTLTFTRHKSSKFEGSGLPLRLLSHRYSVPLRHTSWVVGSSTRGHSRTSVWSGR